MSAEARDAAAGPSNDMKDKPTVVLVIGMAGSGKTTFMQRLNAHLHQNSIPGYLINLDPAVMHVPYGASIDIRDTVHYKEVMKQYNLGPNGGIVTSLNLFATKFDQVMTLCERKRDPPLKYIVADTPGQIEIFTWSASGAVITEAFASGFPTVVLFVIDTPRCQNPQTFMSNMLQACSILYKTRLPIVLMFNKTDVASHEFCLEWMEDYEKFHAALEEEENYAASLSRSLSLVLDEFYRNLRSVGVSALTGMGMPELLAALEGAREEYLKEYLPDLEARRRAKDEKEVARQKQEIDKLRKDMEGTTLREALGPEAGAKTPPAGSGAGAAK